MEGGGRPGTSAHPAGKLSRAARVTGGGAGEGDGRTPPAGSAILKAQKSQIQTGSYERRNRSRATSRNGTTRYTAIAKYTATATAGQSNPMMIASTYPTTTDRSFCCAPGGSSPSLGGE